MPWPIFIIGMKDAAVFPRLPDEWCRQGKLDHTCLNISIVHAAPEGD
jgi:hypothetical protein